VLKRAVQHKCDGFDPAMRMPRESVPSAKSGGRLAPKIAVQPMVVAPSKRPFGRRVGPTPVGKQSVAAVGPRGKNIGLMRRPSYESASWGTESFPRRDSPFV
jgi:hypothetical protein